MDKEINRMKNAKPLKPKDFDAKKYEKIISQRREHMDLRQFEELCSPIAMDILQNYNRSQGHP